MKIGDYVRTKDGIILKIKDIEDIYTTDNIYISMAIYDNEGHFVNEVEIIKSSSNIIDLIEVGDYVNGREVIDVYKMLGETHYCFKNEYGRHYDKTYKIKSIVTKEQFESMEYKVVE